MAYGSRLHLFMATAGLAIVSASPALAADTAPNTIDELTVTAQKRAENIQDVPLSIIALSSRTLQAKNVDDVRGLERTVPNLRIDTISQVSGVALRIRGFGASSNAAIDPSVAPYIDGVFIPRPGAVLTTFLDVESVEVLRGPQGTLFGRNATVGAISIRTAAPTADAFGARAGVEVGNFGSKQVDGMVNVPVSDRLAVRFAGIATQTDGYIKNLRDGETYGGQTTTAGRVSGRWDITPDVTWTVRADYAQTTGDGVLFNQVDTSTASATQLANFTAVLRGNPPTLAFPPNHTVNQLYTNLNLTDRQYGIASDLNWSIGGYDLRLISSFRDWENQQSDGDVIYTSLDLLTRDSSFDSKAQSHELQLISPKGALLGGRLDFVAGLYYFEEDYKIGEVLNLLPSFCSFAVAAAAPPLLAGCIAGPKAAAADGLFTQNAKSTAAYAQATFAILPTLDFILGARQTWDKKDGTFFQTLGNPGGALLRAPENTRLKFDDDQPNWRANLTWRITPDVMTFVTYSTGYKSGGLNSAGGAAALNAKRLFNSEKSKDWEVGAKTIWLDRRLQLNVTAFQTKLAAFQERSFDGVSFIIRNAGSVRARGVELEGQALPIDGLKIDFGLAYLESIFTDNTTAPGLPACNNLPTSCPRIQNLTGRPTTFAPKWNGNIGIEYTTKFLPGGFSVSARGDLNYSSRYYSTNDLNPQTVVDEHTLFGGRITLISPDESWRVALFGENLTDRKYFKGGKFVQTLDTVFGVRVPATGATLVRGYPAAPRTYGVRLSKTF